MHEMQTIVTDVRGVCLSACPSVSLSNMFVMRTTRLHYAKMARWIKKLFGVNTAGAHGTLCKTGVLIPHGEGKGDIPLVSPERL